MAKSKFLSTLRELKVDFPAPKGIFQTTVAEILRHTEGWNYERKELSASERESVSSHKISIISPLPDETHLRLIRAGAEAWNKWRAENPSVTWPSLDGAKLSGVVLRGADMRGVTFRAAALSGADLQSSDLSYADFTYADVTNVNMRNTNLWGTDFTGARMEGADVSKSMIAMAKLGDLDLSVVKGLDTLVHVGASTLGIDTIYKSGGNIPEAFLRGCGVPEGFVTYARALTTQAIDFYSCSISHSSKDHEFVERLHADLQAKGVRVWFAPHDMKIGARIRHSIDESIRVHDKLLLVLSEHSVSSQRVEQEVETALAKEREQEGRTVLFPIRIDEAVMEGRTGWPALLKNTRNVGDFTNWKSHDDYQKAFDRLLRDLKAGT
jgi:hypothetical protein